MIIKNVTLNALESHVHAVCLCQNVLERNLGNILDIKDHRRIIPCEIIPSGIYDYKQLCSSRRFCNSWNHRSVKDKLLGVFKDKELMFVTMFLSIVLVFAGILDEEHIELVNHRKTD